MCELLYLGGATFVVRESVALFGDIYFLWLCFVCSCFTNLTLIDTLIILFGYCSLHCEIKFKL